MISSKKAKQPGSTRYNKFDNKFSEMDFHKITHLGSRMTPFLMNNSSKVRFCTHKSFLGVSA